MAIMVLGGITLGFVIFRPSSEPEYLGKSLSYWLQGFESDKMEVRWQSAEALRQMGTNALPKVISQLHQPYSPKTPSWRDKLSRLLSKQSLVNVSIQRPPNQRTEALAALAALGPMAKRAVPALENLLHESPPDHRALMVLAQIGPEAIPALTRALTNGQQVIRLGAQECLNMQQSNSEFLFPKSAQEAEFARRQCEFNRKMLNASLQKYRAQHPENFSEDGRPRSSAPPDFILPDAPETNRIKHLAPGKRPEFE